MKLVSFLRSMWPGTAQRLPGHIGASALTGASSLTHQCKHQHSEKGR